MKEKRKKKDYSMNYNAHTSRIERAIQFTRRCHYSCCYFYYPQDLARIIALEFYLPFLYSCVSFLSRSRVSVQPVLSRCTDNGFLSRRISRIVAQVLHSLSPHCLINFLNRRKKGSTDIYRRRFRSNSLEKLLHLTKMCFLSFFIYKSFAFG